MHILLETGLHQRRRMIYMAQKVWNKSAAKNLKPASLSEICNMIKPVILNEPKNNKMKVLDKIV